MLNLIKTDLKLYVFSKWLLISCAVIAFFCVKDTDIYNERFINYSVMRNDGYTEDIVFEQYFRSGVHILALIVLAVYTAFAVSNERALGTLRNRLTAGYGKPRVYLSKLVISQLIAAAMFLSAIAPTLIVCWEKYYGLMETEKLFKVLVLAFLPYAVIAVFSVMASVLCRHRSAAIIICGGAVLAFAAGIDSQTHILRQPKVYLSAYSYYPEDTLDDETGEFYPAGTMIYDPSDIMPNNEYVDDPYLTFIRWSYYINPFRCLTIAENVSRTEFVYVENSVQIYTKPADKNAQKEREVIQKRIGALNDFFDRENERVPHCVICMLGIALAFTAYGMLLFCRRDLE